jgi:hypothetical protein
MGNTMNHLTNVIDIIEFAKIRATWHNDYRGDKRDNDSSRYLHESINSLRSAVLLLENYSEKYDIKY